ncbi:MAG: glycosyltransferase [Actinomycetota bacterium]|nr:glycosyltransferase [Actinomycetota bacterium]
MRSPDPLAADVTPHTSASSVLVSFVLPVHNGAEHVAAAIDSVLAQGDTEIELVVIEVVVVDDGSTDGTAEVLARYAHDPRVRVVRHEVNLGLVAALNRGLRESRGELVARLDADDLALPGRLAAHLAAMAANPALVLHATAYERALPSGEVLRRPVPPMTHGALAMAAWAGNQLCHSAVMFRRQVAIDVGGYREEWFPVEDFDLWLRLMAVGEYGGSAHVGTRYLVNPDGISKRHDDAQRSAMRARADAAAVSLVGSAAPTGSVRARLRHLQRYHRALRRQLSARLIGTDGLDATAARIAFDCTAGRPRLVRHLQVASGAPRVWWSSLWRRAWVSRRATGSP